MIIFTHLSPLRQVLANTIFIKRFHIVTLDEFLAVGSLTNKKAELYNYGSDSWETVDDYPFTDLSSVSQYVMLYIPQIRSYLVIGGSTTNLKSSRNNYEIKSEILKFQDGAWFDVGQLNSARNVSFYSVLLFLKFNQI